MNTDILISKSRNGDNLKENLLDILYVADKYPDVILVFPDFVGFVEKSYDFNLDVVEIFKDVLVNKKTPIIAITDKADFFTLIEPNFELMKYFDKYVVPKIDKDFIIRVLQREAHKIENKDKVNIIFPVINKIAEKHLNESDPIKSSLVELHKIYQ